MKNILEKMEETRTKKENNKLSSIYNDEAISTLASIGRNKFKNAFKEKDALSNETPVSENGYIFLFDIDNHYKLSEKTIKLLDFYLKIITENIGHNDKKTNSQLSFSFELNEYVRLLGKDPYKKNDVDIVRRELMMQSVVLRKITFLKDDGNQFEVNGIINKVRKDSRGVIEFFVSESFMENIIYNKRYLMKIPNSIFKLADNKGNAYRLARKLCYHYGLNNNVLKGTNNVLTIHKLLQATDIQSFEEIQKTNNRNWKLKIAKKLSNLLDYLESENIIKYDILDKESKKINIDEELSKMTFPTFNNLKIKFTILDFPPIEEMRKEINEKREKKRLF